MQQRESNDQSNENAHDERAIGEEPEWHDRLCRPTLDGEAYYRRCIALLADLEDAESAFAGVKPRGQLRVDVQGTLARHFIVPSLPSFFAAYPDIELSMSEGERWIDLVREGVDCVLRFGNLPDSDLVARRVVTLTRITCAAPGYFAATD